MPKSCDRELYFECSIYSIVTSKAPATKKKIILFCLRQNTLHANLIDVTPPLNRAQFKIKCHDNISMAFLMSDQADFKYVQIKTFHLHTVPHRKLIFVTND